MADPKSPAAKRELKAHAESEHKRRISIAWTLILSFGSLTTIAILVVLGLAVWTAGTNTISLLRDRADLGIRLLLGQVQNKLDPALQKTRFIADAVARGDLDPADREKFGQALYGAMAGGPAVGAVVFIGTDLKLLGARRRLQKSGAVRLTEPGAELYTSDFTNDATVKAAMRWAATTKKPRWGAPVWRPNLKFTILSLQYPVWRKGRLLGIIISAVRIDDISRLLPRGVADGSGTVFITYGRDRVLAHPLMARGYAGLSAEHPLPELKTFRDPVLARLWTPKFMRTSFVAAQRGLQNHNVVAEDTVYVAIYRELKNYTPTPWYVGVYFPGDVIGRELERLVFAIVAGLVALLVAIIIAFIIGRRLAAPIGRLSTSARLASEMRFDDIHQLPPSRVRELDDQSETFNSMVGALKWFQAYVPKPLVRRLLKDGDLSALESDKRHITVMFTDIAGYSTVSEGKTAAEIAGLLNDHFTILAHAVEDEGGTVDKFIGDSVMAFWGAPEKQKNRAIRACRAALAIRDAIAADNKARAARGEPPVRLRIGIHSGEATVGNIGPPDRVNYTVIGDDVNVAQRLEQLGKEIAPDEEVAITISAATLADLEDGFEVEPAGEMHVKGRAAPVEVFRLKGLASSGARLATSEA